MGLRALRMSGLLVGMGGLSGKAIVGLVCIGGIDHFVSGANVNHGGSHIFEQASTVMYISLYVFLVV